MPLNGSTLSPCSALPFLGLLLSIAIIPLFASRFWAGHYGKIAFVWSAIALVVIASVQGPGVSLYSFVAVMIEQYIPFIMVLLALYTITGGIKIHGAVGESPVLNTVFLLFGAVAANLVGTAGASVLLVRPLLFVNARRKTKIHTVMFFVFLVGNIGGSLTPIGNPPLLMGLICKVGFLWPLTHLLLPTAFAAAVLLILYFAIDSFFYKKEGLLPAMPEERGKLRIEGKANAVLLIAVVLAVLLSAMDLGRAFEVDKVEMPLAELLEILLLGGVTVFSYRMAGREVRTASGFTWHPILEVGKLFAGIFVTMAPLVAMLRAGADGPMKIIVQALTGPDGQPVNVAYFWLTGLLSGFLDSAPAYVVAFQTASAGHPNPFAAAHVMMTTKAATLVAVIFRLHGLVVRCPHSAVFHHPVSFYFLNFLHVWYSALIFT